MIRKIIAILMMKLMSHNKYAKKVGVKFGKNCIFRTKNFGSEPFLITIGDNFETSGGVSFVTHDGGVGVLRNIYSEYKDIDFFNEIIIGNNVFIGLNAVILPGTVIGDNVIIAAGSIVKGEIKSNSIYGGSPAKYIKSINDYLEQNKKYFVHTFYMNAIQKEEYLRKLMDK